MIYKFKKIFTSIKINKSVASGMINLINKKTYEANQCLNHVLNYAMQESYRRYRRGKNRCLRCGLKL